MDAKINKKPSFIALAALAALTIAVALSAYFAGGAFILPARADGDPPDSPALSITDWVYGQPPNAPAFNGAYAEGTLRFSYEGINGTDYAESETPPENAGDYKVVAKFSPDGDLASNEETEFRIKKADYDLSQFSVTFADASFAYDGGEKNLEIKVSSGVLPDGVKPVYENNGKRDPGEYLITVRFTADSNHNPIEQMQATLTITDGKDALSSSNGGGDEVTLLTIALIALCVGLVAVFTLFILKTVGLFKNKNKENA